MVEMCRQVCYNKFKFRDGNRISRIGCELDPFMYTNVYINGFFVFLGEVKHENKKNIDK
jgi:hypothetical protein